MRYLTKLRLQQAATALAANRLPIHEIARRAGYRHGGRILEDVQAGPWCSARRLPSANTHRSVDRARLSHRRGGDHARAARAAPSGRLTAGAIEPAHAAEPGSEGDLEDREVGVVE